MIKIRKAHAKDLDKIMEIWLDTNISAHSFISSLYWKNNFNKAKNAIEKANVTVATDNDQIVGFIGLVQNYIAGLFVQNNYQNKSIGTKLLNHAKETNDSLLLSVYVKNTAAIKFYKHNGFRSAAHDTDQNTGQAEINMIWNKK